EKAELIDKALNPLYRECGANARASSFASAMVKVRFLRKFSSNQTASDSVSIPLMMLVMVILPFGPKLQAKDVCAMMLQPELAEHASKAVPSASSLRI